MTDSKSAPERVQAAYRSLSASATNLNAASDELRKTVSVLEQALEKLNLGISTWVTITGDEEGNGYYWSRDLGYAKIDSKWGIALRTVSGHYSDEGADKIEEWSFNDAPRWLRIEGVGKFPELLEKLTKQADDFTEKIKKKTAEANELASIITLASADTKPANKLPLVSNAPAPASRLP
jgi:hypothetical protein